MGFFLWHAFFGAIPNDASVFVAFSALPGSLLIGLVDYVQLRDVAASLLHQPITDRFALAFDATAAWTLGCMQYGVLGILISRSWRAVRRAKA